MGRSLCVRAMSPDAVKDMGQLSKTDNTVVARMHAHHDVSIDSALYLDYGVFTCLVFLLTAQLCMQLEGLTLRGTRIGYPLISF